MQHPQLSIQIVLEFEYFDFLEKFSSALKPNDMLFHTM